MNNMSDQEVRVIITEYIKEITQLTSRLIEKKLNNADEQNLKMLIETIDMYNRCKISPILTIDDIVNVQLTGDKPKEGKVVIDLSDDKPKEHKVIIDLSDDKPKENKVDMDEEDPYFESNEGKEAHSDDENVENMMTTSFLTLDNIIRNRYIIPA